MLTLLSLEVLIETRLKELRRKNELEGLVLLEVVVGDGDEDLRVDFGEVGRVELVAWKVRVVRVLILEERVLIVLCLLELATGDCNEDVVLRFPRFVPGASRDRVALFEGFEVVDLGLLRLVGKRDEKLVSNFRVLVAELEIVDALIFGVVWLDFEVLPRSFEELVVIKIDVLFVKGLEEVDESTGDAVLVLKLNVLFTKLLDKEKECNEDVVLITFPNTLLFEGAGRSVLGGAETGPFPSKGI